MAARRSIANAPIDPHVDHGGGRSLAWPVMTLLVGAAAILVAAQLPAPLVPLVMSIIMVAAGLAIAACSYLAGSRIGQDPSTVWQIAGALVFLGFAAAMLADDEHTLSLLAQMEAQLVALAR